MAENFEWLVRVRNDHTELWNKPEGTELAELRGETSGLVASIVKSGADTLLVVSNGDTCRALDGENRTWREFSTLMDEVKELAE